jgi:UPF0716 protein FxsA
MRRRIPWWVLALLFVVLPLVEIYFIVQLGQAVGPWWTILVLVAAGALGSWLVTREGGRAWRALQEALASHRMPAKELADGALILVGGTLLLTPGFVSDFVGLFCILPVTRPLARAALTRLITRRLEVRTVGFGGAPGPGSSPPGWPRTAQRPTAQRPTAQRPGHTEVIRGEVVDDDR